jgi:hypothetical protein
VIADSTAAAVLLRWALKHAETERGHLNAVVQRDEWTSLSPRCRVRHCGVLLGGVAHRPGTARCHRLSIIHVLFNSRHRDAPGCDIVCLDPEQIKGMDVTSLQELTATAFLRS